MTDLGPYQSFRMVKQVSVRLYIGRRFWPSVHDLSMRWRLTLLSMIPNVIEMKDVVRYLFVLRTESISTTRIDEKTSDCSTCWRPDFRGHVVRYQ